MVKDVPNIEAAAARTPEEIVATTWNLGRYMISETLANGKRHSSVWKLPGSPDPFLTFLDENPEMKRSLSDLAKMEYGYDPDIYSARSMQAELLHQT